MSSYARRFVNCKVIWSHRFQPLFDRSGHGHGFLSGFQRQRMAIGMNTFAKEGSNINNANESFRKKLSNIWQGPNFKYWFIGVNIFTIWLSYYGYKAYKRTRIDVFLPPPIPIHILIQREDEVDTLRQLIANEPLVGGKLKVICFDGPCGVGKSILAYLIGQSIIANLEWTKYSLPKSKIMVSLNCDTTDSLILSLQGFASKLQIKPSELRKIANVETELALLPKTEQCDALLTAIQETLSKHPNWVIIFDNLQLTTPKEVISVIKKWFIDNETKECEWNKGTVILTCDGPIFDRTNIKQIKISGRMLEMDAIKLLSKTSGIEELSLQDLGTTRKLLNKIYFHPLSIACVGVLLKAKLEEGNIASINQYLTSMCEDLENNVMSVKSDSSKLIHNSLIVLETVIAMTTRHLIDSDPYLLHTFDLIGSCAPSQPIPFTLISRHFKTRFFNLPPLVTDSGTGIKDMFKKNSTTTDENDKSEDDLTPKGKAWSTKRLAEDLRKIEDWFTRMYTTVMEIYDLYYNTAKFDIEEEDGLDMIRGCPLFQCIKLEPGGVESIIIHPLIYAVARQNLLASSASKIEEKFLLEDRERYDRQSWYRKMSSYDAKTNLTKFRNNLSDMKTEPENASQLIERYNNPVVDVSSVLRTVKAEPISLHIPTADRVKHLRSHLERTLTSISDELTLAKQSISGKTMSKYLGRHAEYILNSHSVDVLGTTNRTSGLLMLSSVCFRIYNDPQSALVLLDAALKLQRESLGLDHLDVANTLTQLGNVYRSIDDTQNGKVYLDQAVDIYEKQRKSVGEYKQPLQFGKTLAALGMVCSAMGERHKCKEYLERSLMLQQAGAPSLTDDAKSKHFGAEFASSLTDLGHAYLSEGMPLYGKKILDLALVAHKNINGENHPEVVRTMNMLSIAHTMQGHNQESKKLRTEAGKINVVISNQPLY